MEHRVRYLLLGLFVFGVGIAGVWFILWQGKYAQGDAFDHYKVNTRESVSGLNDKAPVKLRGVNVGEVERLFINPQNSEEVSIIIKIKADTPIKIDTYALIEPQGITGLSYLQLEGGAHEAPLLPTSNEEKTMGIILTKPSLFSRVDQSFGRVMEKVEAILEYATNVAEKSNLLLDETNIHHFQTMLENSAKTTEALAVITQALAKEREQLGTLIRQGVVLEEEVIDAAKGVRIASDTLAQVVENQGVAMMEKVSTSAQSVQGVMQAIDQKVGEGMFDVASIVQDALVPTQHTMYELELLMVQLRQLAQRLEESPSDLLYRSAPRPLGPGE
ncbi:MAG: MCE family protein [Campylobacterales bacterium]|nr:MCE family protein [Campylobacterales bacterium]